MGERLVAVDSEMGVGGEWRERLITGLGVGERLIAGVGVGGGKTVDSG